MYEYQTILLWIEMDKAFYLMKKNKLSLLFIYFHHLLNYNWADAGFIPTNS